MSAERYQILKHKGKDIIFHDCSNLAGAEYIEVLERHFYLVNEVDLSEKLILVDVTNTVVDKNVLQTCKKIAVAASGRMSKTAVYGLSGIQLLFLNIVVSVSKIDVKTFDTRDKALDWLTS